MPVYFGPVAPYCPVSRDQPVGNTWQRTIRTTVPHAHDLASALAAVNIMRSIVIQLVFNRVINNIYTPPPPKPTGPDRTIDKQKSSRWVEDTSKRVRRKYKYYGYNTDGSKDKDTWVMTERIEQMVWRDPGWQTSLRWSYGDKGEGEQVPPQ